MNILHDVSYVNNNKLRDHQAGFTFAAMFVLINIRQLIVSNRVKMFLGLFSVFSLLFTII